MRYAATSCKTKIILAVHDNALVSTAGINHHCATNCRENIACIAGFNREVKLFFNNLHRVLRPGLQD